ncbi:MAG: type II toxin-antitoxin system RelE/ParE family toxin [Candidatus Anammoxibacter sp.]
MSKPLKIQRTLIARAKLEEIYEYSCEQWSIPVARKYLIDIENAIQQAANDKGGLKRNTLWSKRFTYTPVRKHLVFFDVKKDTLFVATLFHGVMDIKNRLAEEMAIIQREITY